MVTRVPRVLLRHRVTVEPYAGESAYGPQYRHAIPEVPALVDATPRMVRAPDGRQVVASATVIADPALDCPPGSRITLPDGRTTTAITVGHHTAPGLPVPACTEVMCE
ncbi:putative hypothetical protein [Streptomyces sp. NBRC 110611]|uniref:hypothetical protein n=1 Tax=Streptomyces sp. NBRC 110611 TaxID=1621259 RepID=UPI0008361E3C|nr:hypothetical protein [Streptomyces sp. NBRC 110611]GAU67682.1 putative hypothetical protein [Streptomyces sp. NBRC 110611]